MQELNGPIQYGWRRLYVKDLGLYVLSLSKFEPDSIGNLYGEIVHYSSDSQPMINYSINDKTFSLFNEHASSYNINFTTAPKKIILKYDGISYEISISKIDTTNLSVTFHL